MTINQWKAKQQFLSRPLQCLTDQSQGVKVFCFYACLIVFVFTPIQKWDPHNEPEHPESVPGFHEGVYGSRFFGGESGSSIKIHGRKMERTWTLLSSDAQQGSTTLELRDDPKSMGWRVGDIIGVAKTDSDDFGRGQQTKIVDIQQFKIIVEDEMEALRWGGIRNVEGHEIEMATEIINLR